MVIVKVTPFVKKEYLKNFSTAFKEIAPIVRKEEGCIEYKLLINSEDSEQLLFFERWESREALDVHLKTAHMSKFFESIENWITAPPEIKVFEAK